MKTTIESLDFPSEVKNKLKMKVSPTNLKIKFLSGHIIKFDKTNLCAFPIDNGHRFKSKKLKYDSFSIHNEKSNYLILKDS